MTVGFSKFENGDAQTFASKFLTLKPTLLYSNAQSFVGFSPIPKMRDLKWPVNVIQDVFAGFGAWCVRVAKVAVFSRVHKRSIIDVL